MQSCQRLRWFEQILSDADKQYNTFKADIGKDSPLSDEELAGQLQDKFDEVQETIDQRKEGSRMWKLSNRCIYGTDANDRMARTSKMNMIMHGDGHGGVHHHDGFLNVNGIFEGRFDIIITNPPFGANVEPSDTITEEEITISPDAERRYIREYGKLYTEAQERVRAALNEPISSLFKLPKSPKSKKKLKFFLLNDVWIFCSLEVAWVLFCRKVFIIITHWSMFVNSWKTGLFLKL